MNVLMAAERALSILMSDTESVSGVYQLRTRIACRTRAPQTGGKARNHGPATDHIFGKTVLAVFPGLGAYQ